MHNSPNDRDQYKEEPEELNGSTFNRSPSIYECLEKPGIDKKKHAADFTRYEEISEGD
jgi:hypothetical protein